jgi:hypothetical protein
MNGVNMNQLKKKYRKLFKYYKKELSKYNKNVINGLDGDLAYLITYLRYLRDYYLLVTKTPLDDPNLIALCNAVGEYELYTTCIHNYYKIENNTVTRLNEDLTPEQTQHNYQMERKVHWSRF